MVQTWCPAFFHLVVAVNCVACRWWAVEGGKVHAWLNHSGHFSLRACEQVHVDVQFLMKSCCYSGMEPAVRCAACVVWGCCSTRRCSSCDCVQTKQTPLWPGRKKYWGLWRCLSILAAEHRHGLHVNHLTVVCTTKWGHCNLGLFEPVKTAFGQDIEF